MDLIYASTGESGGSINISNLGDTRLPEEMLDRMERLDFIIGPQRSYPNNCSVVSCGRKTSISMIRNIRLIIIGGFMILLGGFTILTEFLEFITFGRGMFQWSLYTAAVLGICGIFMILSGIIPAMRHHLKKRFFY